MKELRGDAVDASFGQQIRNYVLHPYKAMMTFFLVGDDDDDDGDDVVVDVGVGVGVVAAESMPPESLRRHSNTPPPPSRFRTRIACGSRFWKLFYTPPLTQYIFITYI